MVSQNVIPPENMDIPARRSFKDFAGMMSDDEANEIDKIIEEGCEQIHPDDWK